jgi:hypothetical protein
MMNADATGADWQDIKVTTTPPGENSRNRQGAATDFPLVAEVPADQTYTGTVAGQENVCLVRCQNAARASPFGGVVPVQMAGAQTPAQARRALAIAMKRSEEQLARMIKRASKIDTSKLTPEESRQSIAKSLAASAGEGNWPSGRLCGHSIVNTSQEFIDTIPYRPTSPACLVCSTPFCAVIPRYMRGLAHGSDWTGHLREEAFFSPPSRTAQENQSSLGAQEWWRNEARK